MESAVFGDVRRLVSRLQVFTLGSTTMKILAQSKSAAMAMALAFGMAGLAFPAQTDTSQANAVQVQNAQTNSHSRATVRDAQQKLKDGGFYTGKTDGQDGPVTHAAIRKYQQSQNLTVNGRLDQQTRNKLGVQNQ